MGKIEKALVIVLSFSLILSLLLIVMGSYTEADQRVCNVSVIINEANDDYWEKFEKGVAQAAVEYNADVNFVTLYEKDDVSEQVTLMKREIENGADALIVAPAGKEEMEKLLSDMEIDVPIILVEGSLDSEKVNGIISVDQEALGYDLGMAMKTDGIKKCVIYKGKGRQSYIRERFKGLERACEEAGIFYTETAEQPETYFWSGTQAVVAIDEALTGELCSDEINKYYGKKVYGVGSSSHILEYLNDGEVEFLAVINSFDEGYLSLQAAVQQMKKEKGEVPAVPEYYGIRRDMMYEKKYQRLLFPLS